MGFVKRFQKLFFQFSSSTSSVFATTGFLGLLPLDIVIVAHLGGFVKGFSKLFLKKFCRPASLGSTSMPPDIVYYSRYWDKKQVVKVHKFSTNFLAARY